MENLPESCYVGKIIAKDHFKRHKNEFTDKVERLKYKYQISSNTTNYDQENDHEAIVVINILLRQDSEITNIVKEIVNSINYNLIFEIEYKGQKKYGFYEKKLFTNSYKGNHIFDLIAPSVQQLYESLQKQILGNTKKSLSIEEVIQAELERDRIKTEINKLKQLKSKEKQFNKKAEIRKEIQQLKEKLEKTYE